MTSIPNRPAADKRFYPDGHRAPLLAALRAESARSKLEQSVFDAVFGSLQSNSVTVEQAIEWLESERLIDRVQRRVGMSGVAK